MLEREKMKSKEELYQEDLKRIQALRYMDDDFFTVCLADNIEGVQLILRIVLQNDNITVTSVKTQEHLKNLRGRSAVLDVHAVDSDGKQYDCEIQRSDAGAGAKRARHNSSLLDAHILQPGEDTEDLPESYVIFITENDVMQGGEAVYPVDRYVRIGGKNVLFEDGSHILYVNGKYRGKDAIGKLMEDFSCADPDQMNYEPLAERARFYKKDEKGVGRMCKLLEDMRNETAREAAQEAALSTARENALRMIKDGQLSLETIAKYVNLPLEEIKALAAPVMV